MNTLFGLLSKLLKLLHAIEDAILVLLVAVMVLLATLQIFLRNFFDGGFIWGDPLLRMLLLWLGLLGALAASRTNKHISIDVLSHFLSEQYQLWVQALTGMFTAVVCAVVAYHAGRFVFDEYQYATPAFAGLPAWYFELVIPLAFGLMALRYVAFSVLKVRDGVIKVTGQ